MMSWYRRLVSLSLGATIALAVPGFDDRAGAQASREIRVVALGDSLTAGFGLPPSDAFPVRLEAALRARGHRVAIENAGVSGDTSAGGLERLDWSVGDGVDAVILELGANDALRGIDPAVTRHNLAEIVRRLKTRRIEVLIAGMRAPPNLGAEYARAFDPIFSEIAAAEGLILYPFFLEGVATQPTLNLADGIHPNARGVAIIVESIAPRVEELLARVRGR